MKTLSKQEQKAIADAYKRLRNNKDFTLIFGYLITGTHLTISCKDENGNDTPGFIIGLINE